MSRITRNKQKKKKNKSETEMSRITRNKQKTRAKQKCLG